MRLVSIATILLALAAAAVSAQAPQTREDALRQQREAKASNATPNRPDGLQVALTRIEQNAILLTSREGFHPKIGSLTTGSGFAYGLGYRSRAIFARRGMLETFGAGSFKKYWALESRARFPRLANDHLALEAVGSLREYPQEHFYGVGPDARREDDTTFSLRTATVGGRAGVKPLPIVTVGGGVDYFNSRVGPGRDSTVPTTQQRFAEAPSVFALSGQTDFVRSSLFAELDYRVPLNARQGGYYRVERTRYSDRTTGAFTFDRTDVDLRQYLGFFSGRRVIALRGLLSTTEGVDDGVVPFYLMPWIGGKDTLRGYRDYRFRGPHAMLLQAEYRWEIWSGLEGGLFYDTGKVTLARRDLNLKDLESAYGFGFRFNTDNAVVLRFDAAFGSRDGKRLHMSVGGVF